MKGMVKLVVFVITIFFSMRLASEADWTFLIYMESSDHMTNWAVSNINAMAQAGSTSHVNILTQWHAHQNQAWRYFVGKNTIQQVEAVSIGNNYVNDLVDSMKWAVANYPAKHYCLGLWNHGFGILEPSYVPTIDGEFKWDVEPDGQTPLCQSGFCPLKNLFYILPLKAIMFNDINKSFLTNQQLTEVVQRIKKEVLNGKNLDILGTDACKMAMLEVGHQIEHSVDYLTGCQNCSLADGWNYKKLFEYIGDAYHGPENVAKSIVTSFTEYYNEHDKNQIFTHSVIKLSYVKQLTQVINDLVSLLETQANKGEIRAAAYLAKGRCTPICDAPFYLDIYSFLREFESVCTGQKILNAQDLQILQTLCGQARQLISSMVVANTTGEKFKDVHGISIYFPNQHIDSSYINTSFAQQSLWTSFLKNILACL